MSVRPWSSVVCGMALFFPVAAAGQSPTCGNVKSGEELENPPEITASGGKLNTWFDVRFQTFCVPETDNKDGTFKTVPLKLRTYTSPARRVLPEDTPRPATDLTGPTLRLRKFTPPSRPGDALEIMLKNSLPFPAGAACNSACDASAPACDCSPGTLGALIKKCTTTKDPDCCCVINCTQKAPNCLHGDNVTNLHFHGTHASPQSPQDFVLLDLYPPKPASAPAADHASHGTYGKVAYGQFQYAVQPFGPRQAEGTHWYHPHRHGSVGVQVANGMAGALLIEGEFDDWLEKYYATEKVMVIQSVTAFEPLFKRDVPAAQILVNGQIKPTVTGLPGEIQRWRIVNATMASRTLLSLTLPAGLTFRQIAMDGVRFSPANYDCQPLLNFNVNDPSFPCNPTPSGNPKLVIAPGNRADFLVQLPLKETRKGTEGLRVERELIDISGDEAEGNRKLLLDRDEAMAPGPAEPPLFTIVVDDGIEGNDDEPKVLEAGAPTMPLPKDWPEMPDYLSIIERVDGQPVAMTFQQFLADSQTRQWPYGASPLSSFKIDGRQFCPTCVNVTTLLNTAAEWTVSNGTLLPHPFHIHTNPFQVFSVKGVPVRPPGQTKPEPFWMDTLMIPTAAVDPKSAPADPGAKITITPASYVFRQRYLDFTGEYVLHCHFLGHEDRGMMFAVQTVCNGPRINPQSKGKFGTPTTDPNGECISPPFPNPVQPCKEDPDFCPAD